MDSNERPWMLAIDTSANNVGVALAPARIESGIPAAESIWRAERNQTATALSQIDNLMRVCEIDVGDLGSVAVAIGPGAFTALRVGLSIAKSLSFGLDIPIFGIGTLEATAHTFRLFATPVRAFVRAGRNRVVSGDYRYAGADSILNGKLTHRMYDELAEDLTEPTILAGELSADRASRLQQAKFALVPDPALRQRRPGTLIDIAVGRWRAGDFDDLTRLEPIYIHSRSSVKDGNINR